jgi:hypothetical protein
MENKLKEFSAVDTDNALFILYQNIVYVYRGGNWGQIHVNDVNMPDSDFKKLKKPGLVEISPSIVGKDWVKTFLVIGGYNPFEKNCVKTVYLINFEKNIIKNEIFNKEVITYDCFLDFKYGDMKQSRYLHGSVNIEDQFVFVFGGKNEKDWLKSSEYIDLTNGIWQEGPSLNSERSNFDWYLYEEKGKKTLFVYGGFSGVKNYPTDLIETIDIELINGKIRFSDWRVLKCSIDKSLNLPKFSSRIVRYDDNLIIIGGSDGKHILPTVFELDTATSEITKLGDLKTPRINFHVLLRDDYIHLIGGSVSKFKIDEDSIENYGEKFTFNLMNKIESESIPIMKEILIIPLLNLEINEFEVNQEPGFPYNSSLMSKDFK